MTTILLIILALWVLGLGSGTVGQLIHLLLVVALIVALIAYVLQVVAGRRPLD